jgi:hypothetical protein
MPGSCFSRRNFVKAAGALAGGSLLTQSFGCKGPATSAPKEAALPAGAADYTLNIAVKPVELGPNRPSKRCLDIRLAGFLFFEKALQVETADGGGGRGRPHGQPPGPSHSRSPWGRATWRGYLPVTRRLQFE